MRTLQAFDVDTDELADRLERLADGIRGSGGVMVKEVESGHAAIIEEPSEFELRIKYAAEADYEGVVDPIKYESRTDDEK